MFNIKSRYAVLINFIIFFIILSAITRTTLLAWSLGKADLSLLPLFNIYFKGLLFDLAVAVFFAVPYSIYLLLLPEKWNGSRFNRIFTYAGFFIVMVILMFAFFAEFTFWGEFESRFNFIAVDYLVYTFEVVNNVNESYPLPYLISAMVLLSAMATFIFYRKHIFSNSFRASTPAKKRLFITGGLLALAALFSAFLANTWAERSDNHYQNELAKAGIFSFFSAFRNNELNYYAYYKKQDEGVIFNRIRQELQEPGVRFEGHENSIRRFISSPDSALRPNIIVVTIESFSADFMEHFGNKQHLTPHLDSLANEGILFTDMYSTGTRTVRGMEALTLAVPPTPGNSIVRRQGNNDLFTIGTICKKQGYTRKFFYGGDGYFDNMNAYFGGNGFDITDRGGRLIPGEHFKATRTVIPGEQIHFENAWGICDEDLYDAVIRDADAMHDRRQPFFDFVMTTSNHRPFTYPEGRIDIPSGDGREGAVKYTDYAIGQFVKKIRTKPWFNNTVIVFVADHCASSAGKNEINVGKYHIPCIIYNLKGVPATTIGHQCSQIDLYPTLLGLLHWSYEANWYGKNVLLPGYSPRALVATYQKLGYLQHDSLIILSPQQNVTASIWNRERDEQRTINTDSALVNKAISYYQSAYYLFKHGGMRE